jgi:hypothetical protein
MEFKPQYYVYKDLVETGRQIIYTKDLNKGNIERHFYACIDILKDGIETDFVQGMMIHVVFVDKEEIDLSIFDHSMY